MFLTQASSLIEAARSLGVGGSGLFFRVALPLARPAIAVGIAMVLALGATLLPSRQGARLDPVEALRYE